MTTPAERREAATDITVNVLGFASCQDRDDCGCRIALGLTHDDARRFARLLEDNGVVIKDLVDVAHHETVATGGNVGLNKSALAESMRLEAGAKDRFGAYVVAPTRGIQASLSRLVRDEGIIHATTVAEGWRNSLEAMAEIVTEQEAVHVRALLGELAEYFNAAYRMSR